MYDYKVWRDNNDVFYSITRDEKLITTRQVRPDDMSLWEGLSQVYCSSVEKEAADFLKKAHELAKLAIQNLIEYEKL